MPQGIITEVIEKSGDRQFAVIEPVRFLNPIIYRPDGHLTSS